MSGAAEPSLEDQVWTIAVARLIFGPAMNIQAPPNLRPEGLAQLIEAGINDWGGVSPVTPDHVNPEAPWPHLADLERATEMAGRTLVERWRLSGVCHPGISRQRNIRDPGPNRVGIRSPWVPALALRASPGRQLGSIPRSSLRCCAISMRRGLAREDAWSPGGLEVMPAAQVARVKAERNHRGPSGRSLIVVR
jgi:FO synthase